MLKIQVMGCIGQDATVKADGRNQEYALICFNIAHSDRWKDAQGVQHEKTTWVSCAMRVKKDNASNRAQWLKKGTGLLVQGKPYASSYTDSKGVQTASLNMLVDEFEFTGAGKKSDTPPTANGGVHPRAATTEATAAAPQTAQEAFDALGTEPNRGFDGQGEWIPDPNQAPAF